MIFFSSKFSYTKRFSSSVNLCKFHVESEVFYRFHAFSNSWKSWDSVAVTTKPKVIFQNLSVGNTAHQLDLFEPVEINMTYIVTYKILEIFMIWLHEFCSLLTDGRQFFPSFWASVARHSDCLLCILKNAEDHINISFILSCFTKKLWAILFGNVDWDCSMFRDRITICFNEIWKIWESKT